jgi:type I restriction enzyme S subunit
MDKSRQPVWLKAEDVPPLPGGWRALPTEDACVQLKPGKLFDTKTVFERGAVPVLNQSATDVLGYHDEEPGVQASSQKPVVTFANHTCAMRLMTQPFSCIQNIFPKIGKPGVTDTLYFYYASLGRVGLTDYKGHHPIFRQAYIPVPPLPIQQRIAGILSAYDELMENSQRRIRLLEAMARALYREWFVHFRFPGHEKHSRVASSLGEIPQSWAVVTIDDVCERVTDGSHHSPKSVEDGQPMASSKDMHDWGLNLDTARLISPKDFADLVRNDCKPKKNDVLITKDGANYLKYIFVTRAEQEVVLLSSVAMLRPNARINPHLFAAILKDPVNKGRLKNYVTGAAIPRVILKDFKRFEFLLPSQEVQTAWAKFAEPMTEQIWLLIDKIQNLRRTRDLLLPRLLSGQVSLAEN